MNAPFAALAIGRAVTGGAGALLRGRTLLAVIAIAFGVALGYAVEVINRAAVDELSASLSTLAGRADLQVRGPRNGFDEALYPRLADIDGVAVASPVVEIGVTVRGHTEPLTLLGVDAFRAATINPALVGVAHDRLDTLRPDTIFLSAAAAAWLGDQTENLKATQQKLVDDTCEYVSANPLKSVAIALVAGILISRIVL